MHEVPRDAQGRVPAVVRMLKPVLPRGGLGLAPGDIVRVVEIEADGRGIGVLLDNREYLSLHPSEFEVVQWAEGSQSCRS